MNGVIWSRLPKIVFVGMKTLKLGVADAVSSFKDGAISKCHTLEALGLKPGKYCVKAMSRIDNERIRRAEKEREELLKNINTKKKATLAKRMLELEEEEADAEAGPSYAAGTY